MLSPRSATVRLYAKLCCGIRVMSSNRASFEINRYQVVFQEDKKLENLDFQPNEGTRRRCGEKTTYLHCYIWQNGYLSASTNRRM
jgi:hypothetical protein